MSKFINYNSSEYKILKELFKTMPMMDSYIANIIEEFIYSIVKEYYTSEEGGGLKCEYRTKYGEIDGEYKEWYNNGQLYIQTTYVEGKLHGEYKEWYDNKQLRLQTTYVEGKLHGEYKDWWSNGQLYIHCNYVEGKFHGEYKRWYYNGQILNQHTYNKKWWKKTIEYIHNVFIK